MSVWFYFTKRTVNGNTRTNEIKSGATVAILYLLLVLVSWISVLLHAGDMILFKIWTPMKSFFSFQIVSQCDYLIAEQREQEKVLSISSKLVYRDTMKVKIHKQRVVIANFNLILYTESWYDVRFVVTDKIRCHMWRQGWHHSNSWFSVCICVYRFFDVYQFWCRNIPRCCVILYNNIDTVYPKKYAHGFVVLCFVVFMQSFIMNSHEVFIHIHQGCFGGTGAIVRLPQCQWSKPDGYGKISQCITTTKHSKAKTVCIFLGIYCMWKCQSFHAWCNYLAMAWLQ